MSDNFVNLMAIIKINFVRDHIMIKVVRVMWFPKIDVEVESSSLINKV